MNISSIGKMMIRFSSVGLRTQIFHTMDNKTLATPEIVKRALTARIPFHSPMSMIGLYHGKRARHAIKSCFSQKKTNRIKKVHKIKKYFWSELLQKKLYVRVSNKAYRCIKKFGSLDKYILLTPPKTLDSKMGEYYRTLMLRKINDPDYRVPYVFGSGKKQRINQYHRYCWIKEGNKFIIPKDYKARLQTYQRKFGTSVDQFNDDDYKKYLEVERLKKLWGKDIDTQHPLLLEIRKKLEVKISDEDMAVMQEKAQRFKQQYLNHPKNKELRRQGYDMNERQAEKENIKIRQAWLKHEAFGEGGEQSEN